MISLARLVLQPATRVTASEREALERVLTANPMLAQGYELTVRFRRMIAQRDLDALDPWLREAEASGLAPFQAVAQGFRHDYEPRKAARTLPWSTGQCEGQICRVKLIQRMGYGRAKLDLLRQRILPRLPTPEVPMKHHCRLRQQAVA
jgi:transposase